VVVVSREGAVVVLIKGVVTIFGVIVDGDQIRKLAVKFK